MAQGRAATRPQGFRELGLQCQVVRKKEGSKDFAPELKALEARLKRLALQVAHPSALLRPA